MSTTVQSQQSEGREGTSITVGEILKGYAKTATPPRPLGMIH